MLTNYKKYTVLILFIIFLSMGIRIIGQGFLFDYRTTFVASRSMVPEIPVASLLLEEKYKAQDSLKEGDIITFIVADGQGKMRVTHRIIEIDEDGFSTKGDANYKIDPWVVTPEMIESKVIRIFPHFLPFLVIFMALMWNITHFVEKLQKKD